MLLIIILVNIFNLSNNLDIASYHLISIGLLLTIGISIIVEIMFKRTIVNPYVFAILFFLWFFSIIESFFFSKSIN